MKGPKSPTPEALSTAKARAKRQIEDDMGIAPAVVQPHLEAVARGLFDPGFDAAAVAAEPHEQREFRFALGASPRIYYDRLRLDAARWLACETDLPVLEMAAGLGFPDPEAFSRWFKYRTGLSPTKLRDATRRPEEGAPAPAPERRGSADPDRSARAWRGLIAGDADVESGHALIRRLYKAYPEVSDQEESR